MYIKDNVTGRVRPYGTDCHDSLVISGDGRYLRYYNLQCGEGSEYGSYRFTDEKGRKPEEDEEREDWWYFNVGGFKNGRTGNITDRNPHDRFHCGECGFMICDWDAYGFEDETDERFSYDFAMKYCPNCGRKVEK